MNIGKAIKLCRTQRGISQAELAQQAKCSVSYLSMLENNKRDPTLSTMTSIAHALRVPTSILFFLGAEEGDLSGLDKTIIRNAVSVHYTRLLGHLDYPPGNWQGLPDAPTTCIERQSPLPNRMAAFVMFMMR